MEVKKSPKVNLEKKKGIFFEIGILSALIVVFLAFEWKHEEGWIETNPLSTYIEIEDIIIPVTVPDKPAAPPPPSAPAFAELIDIVEKDLEIDEILELNSDDDAQNAVVNTLYDEVYEVGETGENDIFETVEIYPSFNGDMNKWLSSNLRYPQLAIENGIQGKVFVQFVVEKDGSITDVKVVRSADDYLNKEAMRVVKAMPKWNPGLQRNKPVRVMYTIPITFRLQQ
ncbi:energy transducer TonB [Odoribacter sp. OttesenSCG-928-G04]|nr:energy transducer TonB [Odoribacter sp. OttesenSCG-928-G04]